jgi:small-conductance mechanosensitive channel
MLSNNITNYSARDTRRVDMAFGSSYDDDIRKAKQLLQEIIAADERVLPEPWPVIALAFGIVFATVITLLLVPSLYMILDDLDRWWTAREEEAKAIPGV